MRREIACGSGLAQTCLPLGIFREIKTWTYEPGRNCLENTFEAICGAIMQHLGYDRAIEWVNYALIDVIVDGWKAALSDGEERREQKTLKRKAAEEAPDFGKKKNTRVVPDASTMGGESSRPSWSTSQLSLAVMATTPRARIAAAQEQNRLPPEVDPEEAALDHVTAARYFVASASWMKDITQRSLRQAGYKVEFRRDSSSSDRGCALSSSTLDAPLMTESSTHTASFTSAVPTPTDRDEDKGGVNANSAKQESAGDASLLNARHGKINASKLGAGQVAPGEEFKYHEALYVVPDDPSSSTKTGFLVTIGRGESRREAQFRALCFVWDKFKEREPYWVPTMIEDL